MRSYDLGVQALKVVGRGDEIAELALEALLLLQNPREIELHHGDIDRCADRRDDADHLEQREVDRGKLESRHDEGAEHRDVRRDLQEERVPHAPGRREIEECQRGRDQNPGQEWRIDHAIGIAGPQYAEEERSEEKTSALQSIMRI